MDIRIFWKYAVPFVCHSVSHEEVRKMRKRFNSRAFRSCALYGPLKAICKGWPVHHILPISLGGNNDRSNLAIVRPDLEHAIHAFIDAQYRPTWNGTYMLYIPVFSGKIWGLNV